MAGGVINEAASERVLGCLSGCMTATPIIWREERTRLFWSISLILDWVSASMRRLQPLYMLRMFTLRSSRDSWRRSQQRRF